MRSEAARTLELERSLRRFSRRRSSGSLFTRRLREWSRLSWRVGFAVCVIALAGLNGRAELLSYTAFSTASLSAPERCPRLIIDDCFKMDAAAQTYMQLMAAANTFPMDRRIRWAPEQFALRFEVVEQRHSDGR